MTISYNWLCEYLPVKPEAACLSKILTSVGLEVEKLEAYEEIEGGLRALIAGQVLEVTPHPNADKLKVTKVNTGSEVPLQIVCGAPNVAAGQKVIIAAIGTTIYPISGNPVTMKLAKIRGVESQGMICAEDEIGIGKSHAGIYLLPDDTRPGTKVSEILKPYTDYVFEIGLTPNRMDAMSHWGVARDVCAYLSHHDKINYKPILPQIIFRSDNSSLKIEIKIENSQACKRYSGICISNVKVAPSPKWLQELLRAIGQKPINNIVDITNFIQHETGQPLHAFDYDKIHDHKIIVKTLPDQTPFITLDGKERQLTGHDLMICDSESPICIAGVFGGMNSGVTENTKNLFLESAWFDPVFIRKTSFHHNLRTDAAMRFEKGIDISNTVTVLKRAAMMMKEIGGGSITSEIVDVYSDPQPKKEINISFQYLKKLSGKQYHPETVKNILESLSFDIIRIGPDALTIQVPFHKPDILIPADIVEEILRIDGLDNIEIPSGITITPSTDTGYREQQLTEKISGLLTGLGFSEIITNSITNSDYLSEKQSKYAVRLLNNLSNELDVMRPSMIYTALEVVSFNLNRKNNHLKLFEFGKTYSSGRNGNYFEEDHLCLYISGQLDESGWKNKSSQPDIYFLKGIAEAMLSAVNIQEWRYEYSNPEDLQPGLSIKLNNEPCVDIGQVSTEVCKRFDIKQPVFIADFKWKQVFQQVKRPMQFTEVSKYPTVERDLAILIPKNTKFQQVSDQISKLQLNKLKNVKLFDVFESEKLGREKKSLAINLTFLDEEKTLTDKEIDSWMKKIIYSLENYLDAEIRK